MTNLNNSKIDVYCQCGCGKFWNQFRSFRRKFASRECMFKWNKENPEIKKPYDSPKKRVERDTIQKAYTISSEHRRTIFDVEHASEMI